MSRQKIKVTFKVILTSEIDQPYKVISVPEEAPFAAVIRYVCNEVWLLVIIIVQSRWEDNINFDDGWSRY